MTNASALSEKKPPLVLNISAIFYLDFKMIVFHVFVGKIGKQILFLHIVLSSPRS